MGGVGIVDIQAYKQIQLAKADMQLTQTPPPFFLFLLSLLSLPRPSSPFLPCPFLSFSSSLFLFAFSLLSIFFSACMHVHMSLFYGPAPLNRPYRPWKS